MNKTIIKVGEVNAILRELKDFIKHNEMNKTECYEAVEIVKKSFTKMCKWMEKGNYKAITLSLCDIVIDGCN